MEITVIIAIVGTILASLCLCLCLIACCKWCCQGQPGRKSKSLDPHYDVERGGEQIYHVTKLTDSGDDDSDNEETDGIHRSYNSYYHNDGVRTPIYMNDEKRVAERAESESGTLLWTNHGQVFINHPGGIHAEILFTSNNRKSINSISTIYIKNSPCCDCSKALKKYFSSCHYKPTILVGRIWHLYDDEDKQGLLELLKDGFTIDVWDKLHDRMYGHNDTTTINYIRELKDTVHN